MKVKITEYKGFLVIEPIEPEKDIDNEWWPTGQGRIGCVVGNSKKNLGVSKEALAVMKGVRKNWDSIGDLGWWKCDDGTHAFSWFGSIHRIIDPKDAEAARDFRIFENECSIIPNEPPQEAKDKLDENMVDVYAWKEPFSIPEEN